MINPSQRPLPDNTQHAQQTSIHAPGGIRTHDCSRRAAVDLRLRPRGYWGRLVLLNADGKYSHTKILSVLVKAGENNVAIISLRPHSTPKCSHLKLVLWHYGKRYVQETEVWLASNLGRVVWGCL